MEYLNQSKICREFLNQYSDSLYPELLPKLIKVAIYALYKTFHKWNFSMQELDEFINCCNYKNRNFELESTYNNNCPCPPCEEYLIPKVNRIQKLNMGYRPPNDIENSETENGIIECDGYGKFYPNDEVYVNEKNNFYDENYYIPRTHSYRNIQLYHKRLKNPKFITQEKKIYPHWWWNLKDDIEQDDYSENDSEIDHMNSRVGRFPKDIEDKLKKKAKRFRNKSFNGIRPVKDLYYDELKIFPNTDLNNPNNNNYNNTPYQKRDHSPSEDQSSRPYGGTASDGFRRPFPNSELSDNYINNNYTNNYNNNLNNSPLSATSPNLNYRGPINTLGNINNTGNENAGLGPNNGNANNRNNGIGSSLPYNQNNPNNQGEDPHNNRGMGLTNMSSSLFGTSALKTQILNKRKIKESTLLSFDKDFNVNGVVRKVKGGGPKKGLKYSLSGNQLKEDKKGIIRRRKK